MPTANLYLDSSQILDIIKLHLENESLDQYSLDCLENIREIPDIYILSGESSIGIDEVRGVTQKISLAPNFLSRKYIICLDAHKLTESAQNALLKHLEHHYEHLIWLFFTEPKYENSLLTTLRSRLVKSYPITPTNNQSSESYLEILLNELNAVEAIDFDLLLQSIMYKIKNQNEIMKSQYWLRVLKRALSMRDLYQKHTRWSVITTMTIILND